MLRFVVGVILALWLLAPRAVLAQAEALPPIPITAQAPPPPGTIAADYTIVGADLVASTGTERRVVPLDGCAPRLIFRRNLVLYVACTDGTVLSYGLEDALNPRLRSRENVGGLVRGFYVQNDRVFASVLRIEARPVGEPVTANAEASPRRPAEDTVAPAFMIAPLPIAALPSRVGHVLEITGNLAVIDLGVEDGLSTLSRIELFSEQRETIGGERSERAETRLAVAPVVLVSPTRARVRLGLNEFVSIGTRARVTTARATSSRRAPPRAAEFWEVTGALRPFASVGEPAFGFLTELMVGYRFRAPLFVEAAVLPTGFVAFVRSSPLGTTTNAPAFIGVARVAAHFDPGIASAGLGIGVTTFFRPSSSFVMTPAPNTPGLALTQSVRIGTRDGFHLAVENLLAFVQGRIEYVGTRGEIQIPLSERRMANPSWLVFRGGGGFSGYLFGEMGFRFRVRGDGQKGSAYLTPSAGGAGMLLNSNVLFGGPTLGLELEMRM